MSRLATILIVMAAAVFVSRPASACTAAVISGKVTPDGRPLLWKNRDCGFPQNSVKFFKGERFSYIAIVNSTDPDPAEVWIGTNSAGFSIMNTQSYNLVDVAPGEERGAANGRVMCRALEICATVEDFHHFLDTLSKPSLIEANFGVIDARGGAEMLEVDYYSYVVYDANDPRTAPHGYLARTNFSFAGEVNTGSGQVRYMNEDQLLMSASGMGLLTPEWILSEVARSFRHPVLGIDLRSGDFNRPVTSGWFLDYDFIPRRTSSSSVVVQGVRPDENPELTIMWTVLGYPPTGVVMPVWLEGAEKSLPVLLARDEETGLSPLCDWSQCLASKVFSYDQGTGTERYMNWEVLWTRDGDGCMQHLLPIEAAVFRTAAPAIERWRKAGEVDAEELGSLYRELDGIIREGYSPLL